MKTYDIFIIGAGIAGSNLAYFAKKRGLKVLLIDKSKVPASGGSGAAGAFISPKLGKDTPLVNLTNQAYKFSSRFYKKNFLNCFDNSGILRIAKDKEDEKNLSFYNNLIDDNGEILDLADIKKLGLNCKLKGIFFKNGGVVDAPKICLQLTKNIDFLQYFIKSIQGLSSKESFDIYKKDNYFYLQNFKAKKIVLATGYEGFDGLEYMGINGLWGSRGDFYTNSEIKVCVHKNISISANNNGIVKIGATHVRAKEPCIICNGMPLKSIQKEAQNMANLSDLRLKEIICGFRAGSKDYFPLVGKIIDTKYMLKSYPQIKKGYSKAPIKYVKDIFVFNGLGGRGFVFAPLLANWLMDLILNDTKINSFVNPDRLFLKWARRLDKK